MKVASATATSAQRFLFMICLLYVVHVHRTANPVRGTPTERLAYNRCMSPRTATASKHVKRELSRESIVDRALTVMDDEGPDAVTIRRIAQDLGVTPMALYWHVANKD